MISKLERNTRAKREIVIILRGEKRPLLLEELHARIIKKLPRAAFSTVYRVVKNLIAQELVEKIDWRDRGSRYEWTREHHHHIVCDKCGKIYDLADADINLDLKKVAKKSRFVLHTHNLELTGVCEHCR